MLSATLLDGSSLDLPSPLQDAGGASEVDVSGSDVVQALVIAAVIAVVDEVGDGALEVSGQVVVFEQDAALEREVPSLDLALGHRVIGLAARVPHAMRLEPFGQIVGNVQRARVACAARRGLFGSPGRISVGSK